MISSERALPVPAMPPVAGYRIQGKQRLRANAVKDLTTRRPQLCAADYLNGCLGVAHSADCGGRLDLMFSWLHSLCLR